MLGSQGIVVKCMAVIFFTFFPLLCIINALFCITTICLLVCLLVGWFVCFLGWLFACLLVDCLVGCLVGWFAWLVVCLFVG